MTHLPYRQAFTRLYASQTLTYEFPITVEDEKDPPMDGRVDEAVALAEKLSSYGGLFMILIHPNVTDDKLRFLREFTERVRDKAWWGTLAEFGAWWEARDRVELDVLYRDGVRFLRLASPLAVQGLGLKLADGEALGQGALAAKRVGTLTVLDLPAGVHELPLMRSAAQASDGEAKPGD
jgi:hypothetical protein